MITYRACFNTEIGTLYYLWTGDKKNTRIVALGTGEDRIKGYESFLYNNFNDMTVEDRKLSMLEDIIGRYLNGTDIGMGIKLVFMWGTDFEKLVWRQAAEIPFGSTVSYGELAAMCGHPGAARAVGTVLGKNPVMLVVPCHRVILKDGRLGGFSSGAWLKKKLLALEGSV